MDQVSMQRAVLLPFPKLPSALSHEHTEEEKHEVFIQNLKAQQDQVKKNILNQGLAGIEEARRRTSKERMDESDALNEYAGTKQNNDALIRSLYTQHDPRTADPVITASTLHRREAKPPCEMSEMEALNETLFHLNAYEKVSAKAMEKYYEARERRKESRMGLGQERKESQMSYDASRDPRLRR